MSQSIPGTYIVNYSIGSCTNLASTSVTIKANPNPIITGTLSYCTNDGSTSLSADQTYDSYAWSSSGNGQSESVDVADNPVSLMVTQNGCSGTSQPVTINVLANPTPAITGTLSYCSNDESTTLSADQTYDSYLWSSGGNTQSESVDASDSPIGLTVTQNGCLGSAQAVIVTEIASPNPLITGELSYCSNDGNTTLSADQTYDSYSWSTGSFSQSINATNATNPLTLAVTNNGCSGTSQPVSVSMFVAPTQVAISSPSICSNSTATIDVSSSNVGVSYYLRDDSNDEIVKGPIVGNGSTVSFETDTLNTSKTYNVYAHTGIEGSALSFDGSDDRVAINTGDNTVKDNFTVEAWVKPNTTAGNMTILSTRVPGETSFDFKLQNGNIIHGDIGNGSQWIVTNADAAFTYEAGKWYHIAYSISTTGYKIYVNGNEKASANFPSAQSPLLFDPNHSIVTIGTYTLGIEQFDGLIDEVRIWNTTRTAQEISLNHNRTVDPSTNGLVAYYNFSDGTGSSILSDLTDNRYDGTLIAIDKNTAWVEDAIGGNCGIEMTQKVTVTAEDNTKPTIGSLSDQSVVANGSCQATLADYTGAVSASDNCGTPTVTQSPVAGATLGLGTTTITLTATDGAGNKATSTFNVTVTDNIKPTIGSLSDQNMVANGSCQATALDYTGSVSVSDNCGTPTVTQSPVAGATLGLGTTTFTLTAEDASGNKVTTQFNVTVADTTKPTIGSINDQNMIANGSCQATLLDYTGSVISSSDNCSTPTVTQYPVAGATLGLGTTTITLTATDGAGNKATTQFNVTVSDTTSPSIGSLSDQSMIANGSCQATALDYTGSVSVSDNCGTPTVTQSPVAGATLGLGTTTFTLTAEDASGNKATSTFNVTVTDDTNPIFTVCPADITLQESSPTVVAYSVTASDNCGSISPKLLSGLTSGSEFPFGTTNVEYEAEDASGNKATCSFTVTVDNILSASVNEFASKIAVFPNPVSDNNSVTVNLGQELEEVTIEILTAEGQILESNTYFSTNELELSTDKLSEGIYFISINNNSNKHIVKLLK